MAGFPKLIGSRGPSTFLVQTSSNQAFVADLAAAVRYPAMFIESIIARGGWVAERNNPELLAILLKLPLAPADPEPIASATALRARAHTKMLVRIRDRLEKAKAREERKGE